MSGMSQQDAMALWQQAQAPGASGGGFQTQQYAQAPEANGGGFQTQQAPGAGGGGMGIQPVPMGLQVDPAYNQQPQFTMQGAQPRVNGVHSNGLLAPGTMRVDPAYSGQAPMPAMGGRQQPIGRIRGR